MMRDEAQPIIPDRRILHDRRKSPTHPLSLSSLFGSRRCCRRAEDRARHPYVDRYGPRDVLLYVAIILLSVADAFLTLHHLNMGAVEVNPVMGFLLQLGVGPFFLIKYVLTVTSVTGFLILQSRSVFNRPIPVKCFLAASFCLYSVLVSYEIVLLF